MNDNSIEDAVLIFDGKNMFLFKNHSMKMLFLISIGKKYVFCFKNHCLLQILIC